MDELRDKLCYLATPYTNYLSGLDTAFRDACYLAAELTRRGVVNYSPIVYTHTLCAYCDALDPLDHAAWTEFDRAMVRRCDVLIVGQLDGWITSEGVLAEICVFELAKKPIYYLDPHSMELRPRQPSEADILAAHSTPGLKRKSLDQQQPIAGASS